MYTTDSESHTSVTRLLGGEKEQLTLQYTSAQAPEQRRRHS